MQGAENRATLGTSMALTLWGPAPGGALNASSLLAVVMLAPRSARSVDQALREVGAALGSLPPVADAPVPQEVATFATRVVVTPRRLAVEMLGPLILSRSQFLELLVVIEAWSFPTL
jgi:hypothetical protein